MSTADISCVVYNHNLNVALSDIAKNSEVNRTWTRTEGFRFNPLISRCAWTPPYPTKEEQLLNKKKYIFTNNRNNVTSGHSLTKAQKFARVANGFTTQGQPAKRYGTQTINYTNPNQFNLKRQGNTLFACDPSFNLV